MVPRCLIGRLAALGRPGSTGAVPPPLLHKHRPFAWCQQQLENFPICAGIIPMPAALLGALWLLRDVSGAFGGGSSIAHAGHLGGAATGLAFFLAYRRGLIRPRGW